MSRAPPKRWRSAPPLTPGSISSGCCKKRPSPPPIKRFASGKTLMPGGFTPPEQIKSIRGPRAACRVGIGDGGGSIVVTGTPEEVAACEASYTGQYLKRML
ncbi:MAG TPA: excinuclease ABC subunit A [Candidatus Flavonifractor avistercoris]|nr:excinuclease ABC subunit A [Candidatus Flavonifractor avistercoris]